MTTKDEQPKKAAPTATFPPQQFPVVFADGVMSLSHGPNLVKFYLFRTDPSLEGQGGASQNVPVCQIVMPAKAFLTAAVFFHISIGPLLEAKMITKEDVKEVEDHFAKAMAAVAAAKEKDAS